MAKRAAERVFVDTGVLVQSVVPAAPLHAAALTRLHTIRQEDAELWTSRQVLREYLITMRRLHPPTEPTPPAQIAADIGFFQSTLLIAEDNSDVTAALLGLMARFHLAGKQIHDANIVATMQAHRIRKLLTSNPNDYAPFGSLVMLLPLTP